MKQGEKGMENKDRRKGKRGGIISPNPPLFKPATQAGFFPSNCMTYLSTLLEPVGEVGDELLFPK